ncbi:MAG: Arm DNA-binding domain-containing protein [Muribaculum sp.]|nr:Arm DNA-binding domain-containing protein [Muribaculum sp.]
MASTKFFLDTRQVLDCNPAPLKIAIRNYNSTAYINTGVKLLPTQWDANLNKVINNPMKQQLNARISKFKSEIDIMIFDLAKEQNISKWKASDIKKDIEQKIIHQMKMN